MENERARPRKRRWTLALLAIAGLLLVGTPAPAAANAGCPSSTLSFGLRYSEQTCVIDTATTWANGTFVLRGDLIVRSELRLWNLSLRLDAASEQEWRVFVDGGQFIVRGGALTSNTSHHWNLQTSAVPSVLVDLDGVNVSLGGANGGGAYSAFRLMGGNGHRFHRLTVTDSSIAPDWGHAVISAWSADTRDIRIENSTFDGTGKVLHMGQVLSVPSTVVFRDNVVRNFVGGSGTEAVYAHNIDILNNTLNTGSGLSIWIAGGGGPGWPGPSFDHRISSNTISSTHRALYVQRGSGYAITSNTFHGIVTIDGGGSLFAYNTIRNIDDPRPVVTLAANGTARHNTWLNVTLHEQAALAEYGGYGNVSFFANTLDLRCAGTNCMAIQVINSQGEQRPIHPRFPVVEVSWNNITWTELRANTDSVSLDNEFSSRLYVHNNTQRVLPGGVSPGEGVTSSIVAGGARASVFENNTLNGPQAFGIFGFIYDEARNLFQYNRIDDAAYAGIFQVGNTTVRHNTVERAGSGWWICPNGPCAGASTNPANLAFYNNTVRFRPGGTNVTTMSHPDFLNNTFIGHGQRWRNGSSGWEPVHGGWLFFANDTIEKLRWANASGARSVSMTVRGFDYYDHDPDFGAHGTAAVTLEGEIDRRGSTDAATVLWRLDPDGDTLFNVSGRGPAALSVASFAPNAWYRVLGWDSPEITPWTADFATDERGNGGVVLDLDATDVVHLFPVRPQRPVNPLRVTPVFGNRTGGLPSPAPSGDYDPPEEAIPRLNGDDRGPSGPRWLLQEAPESPGIGIGEGPREGTPSSGCVACQARDSPSEPCVVPCTGTVRNHRKR